MPRPSCLAVSVRLDRGVHRAALSSRPRPGGAPLRMAGSRLWLDRYWRQEAQVAPTCSSASADRPADLDLATLRADLDALFAGTPSPTNGSPRRVAALARVSVIAGGPGTGKTTTIARLVAVLRRQHPELRVALAAPTGKAAARLEEAVRVGRRAAHRDRLGVAGDAVGLDTAPAAGPAARRRQPLPA